MAPDDYTLTAVEDEERSMKGKGQRTKGQG